MAKMKKGTNVGLDKNYNNVTVGDIIKDADGVIYEIDGYGHAVRREDGSYFKLSDLPPFELYLPDADADPQDEDRAEKNEQEYSWEKRKESLSIIPDRMLADELRARGYEVRATKLVEL